MLDKYMENRANGVVRNIDHLDLDEEEIKILGDAVKKIRIRRRDQYLASLKRASEIVDSWPEWKRNALGRIK